MPKLQTLLFVTSLSSLLSEHPLITNLLLTIPTAGGEQLLEELAFRCPKDRSDAVRISLVFLWVPVVSLFIIGVVVNTKFWLVFHGCCRRRENQPSKRQKCCTFLIIVYRSLAVPFVWLFVALLDGTYTVCWFAEEPDELTETTVQIYANSQMFAWGLLLLMVIVGTAVTCFARCFAKNTFHQNLYDETHGQRLEEATKKKAIKQADDDAENLVLEIGTAAEPDREENERGIGNNCVDSGNFELESENQDTDRGKKETDNVREETDNGRNEPNIGLLNRCWKNIKNLFIPKVKKPRPESSLVLLLNKDVPAPDANNQPGNDVAESLPSYGSVSGTIAEPKLTGSSKEQEDNDVQNDQDVTSV